MLIYEIVLGSSPSRPEWKVSYNSIRSYDGEQLNTNMQVIGGSGICIFRSNSENEIKKRIDKWNFDCDNYSKPFGNYETIIYKQL